MQPTVNLEPQERRAIQQTVQQQPAQSDEALCEQLREFARQHPQLQPHYTDAYQALVREPTPRICWDREREN